MQSKRHDFTGHKDRIHSWPAALIPFPAIRIRVPVADKHCRLLYKVELPPHDAFAAKPTQSTLASRQNQLPLNPFLNLTYAPPQGRRYRLIVREPDNKIVFFFSMTFCVCLVSAPGKPARYRTKRLLTILKNTSSDNGFHTLRQWKRYA